MLHEEPTERGGKEAWLCMIPRCRIAGPLVCPSVWNKPANVKEELVGRLAGGVGRDAQLACSTVGVD
eukprot:6529858-Pyramimonas_sp.AAC.1